MSGFLASLSAQNIYYVDASQIDNTGPGTSWSTAFKDLQNVIDAVEAEYVSGRPASIPQIWVRQGSYFPTVSPDGSADARHKIFHIKNDLGFTEDLLVTKLI